MLETHIDLLIKEVDAGLNEEAAIHKVAVLYHKISLKGKTLEESENILRKIWFGS